MQEGLKLTITGMLTVFLFLGMLVGLIELMGWLLKPLPDISHSHDSPSQNTPASNTVAAITVAVASYEDEMKI